MQNQTWFNLVAVVTVLTVVGLGVATLVISPSPPATASAATTPSAATVYRNLSIIYDPATGAYNYNVLNLGVPLNVRVVFTITNYDTSTGLLPAASAAVVSGTYGGPMLMQRGPSSVLTDQLPTNDVSHTFSMSNGFYHLNVPIPPAASASVPSQVTFSVVFTVPGTYTWGCVILCGSSSMGMPDQMYGPITVS